MWGVVALITLALVAYLLGSVLWGDIVARRYGVDIWSIGARNPGAANVVWSVGLP